MKYQQNTVYINYIKVFPNWNTDNISLLKTHRIKSPGNLIAAFARTPSSQKLISAKPTYFVALSVLPLFFFWTPFKIYHPTSGILKKNGRLPRERCDPVQTAGQPDSSECIFVVLCHFYVARQKFIRGAGGIGANKQTKWKMRNQSVSKTDNSIVLFMVCILVRVFSFYFFMLFWKRNEEPLRCTRP